MARGKPTSKVLKYRSGCRPETVKRHYLKWRSEQDPPLPEECDECRQHPQWNGKRLKLQLDHRNGVRDEHSPANLRLLCPNCHSQQSTTGGRNRGKVEMQDGGYSVRREDGGTAHAAFAEDGITIKDTISAT